MQDQTKDGVHLKHDEQVWFVAHGVNGPRVVGGRTHLDPRMPTVLFARFNVVGSRSKALVPVAMTYACRFDAVQAAAAIRATGTIGEE